jgi:Spy/CpxP family protein refolding chaperone
MGPKNRRRGLGAALFVGVALAAIAARAADTGKKKDDDWENKFRGHEMWMKSLDEALARSQKESKPLLIDFYSHT